MTLYEKHGRRYVPVHDTAACDGLPNGEWLVSVKGGRRACFKVVDTDAGLELLATIPALTDWLTEEIREHSQARPARPLTPKEKKAWKAYTDIMGEEATLTLTRASAWEAAYNVAKAIIERAKGRKEQAS